MLAIRGGIVGAGLTALLIFALVPGVLPVKPVPCIEDSVFEWFKGVNHYFKEHPGGKHAWMIICGLMMDAMVVWLFARWAIFGKTWRLFIAYIMFYVLRVIV